MAFHKVAFNQRSPPLRELISAASLAYKDLASAIKAMQSQARKASEQTARRASSVGLTSTSLFEFAIDIGLEVSSTSEGTAPGGFAEPCIVRAKPELQDAFLKGMLLPIV